MNALKAKFLLVLWTIIVTLGSLLPIQDSGIEGLMDYDKIAHFIFYFVMSIIICIVLRNQPKAWLLAILFCSAYGWSMELLQGAMELGRHFDYFDIIANIIGALIGTLIFYILNQTTWEI